MALITKDKPKKIMKNALKAKYSYKKNLPNKIGGIKSQIHTSLSAPLAKQVHRTLLKYENVFN